MCCLVCCSCQSIEAAPRNPETASAVHSWRPLNCRIHEGTGRLFRYQSLLIAFICPIHERPIILRVTLGRGPLRMRFSPRNTSLLRRFPRRAQLLRRRATVLQRPAPFIIVTFPGRALPRCDLVQALRCDLIRRDIVCHQDLSLVFGLDLHCLHDFRRHLIVGRRATYPATTLPPH